ncbi:flagellar basal body P-ring formation protein FlgA [bacterium]|nr:flagellar basal body P-ring formation protein FlgA [bacterium]
MSKRIIQIFAGLLFVLYLPMYGQDASVSLKEKVIVQGPVVSLGDLADVSSADGELKSKLERIEIANSPPPLKARILKRAYILSRLKQNQIPVEKIAMTGSDKVIFSTDVKEVTGDDIINCARKYVEGKLSYKLEERVIAIDKKFGSYFVPSRDLRLAVLERKVGMMKGKFWVTVGIYNGGILYRSLMVPVKVRTFEKVVVARKVIKGGKIITQADVTVEKKETTTFGDDVIYSLNDAVGKRAKMTLRGDSILKERILEEIPLVERGEQVTIMVIKGDVVIKVPGRAMQSGNKNEVIRVLNLSSNENLLAQVSGDKYVVIR